MSFKAVLFDLDGTLLDTLEDLADSMNIVLREAGLPEHPTEAYKYFVGDGMDVLVRRALPEDRRDEGTIAGCLARILEEYGRHWADKTRPYEGVPELLDALAARGVKTAILSNKPHDFTQLTVGRLLPHWSFAAVVGARPGGPKKPDPRLPLSVADRLGLPPADFLYLGDTGTDMQTACGAGMYAVGALWGFRTAEELKGNGAKKLIEKPGELLDLM